MTHETDDTSSDMEGVGILMEKNLQNTAVLAGKSKKNGEKPYTHLYRMRINC
jgi:hypothetical protein